MGLRRLALLHLGFTLAMVGVMSIVQFVVYPQYELVAEADFSRYVASHGRRIGLPLALFAPAEVLLALFLWLRAPAGPLKSTAFVAGALLAVAWLTTVFWFGPLHGRLVADPYDPARIDQLSNTNWLRTGLWWVRGGFALWLADRVTRPNPPG